MKQYNILSFMALLAMLCAPGLARAQQTLTVYDGTEISHYSPAYIYYWEASTKSQVIIPATELTAMAGGTISALTFYTDDENVPYTSESECDVYLKEVAGTTLSAYLPKSSATVVYSGTISVVATSTGGTMTITFTSPFPYNGGNLLIGFENTTDAGYEDIYFYGQEVDHISGAYGAGSNNNVPFNQHNFIPKTTFTYNSAFTPLEVTLSGPTSGLTFQELTFTITGPSDAVYTLYAYDAAEVNTVSDMVTKVKWYKPGTYQVSLYAERDGVVARDSMDVTITLGNVTTVTSTANWYGFALNVDYNPNVEGKFVAFNIQQPWNYQIISDDFSFLDIVAGEYYNGNLYLYSRLDNKINVVPFSESNPTVGTPSVLASSPYTIMDMSYSIVDHTMYAIVYKNNEINTRLTSIDLATGAQTILSNQMSVFIQAFAINAEGEAYGITDYMDGSKLYRIDLTDGSLTLVGSTGCLANYSQSMTFDRTTGELLWSQYAGDLDAPNHLLYKVNTTTGQASLVGALGNFSTNLTALFMVYDDATAEVSIMAPSTAPMGTDVIFTAQGPTSGTYVWNFPSATPASATTQMASTTWAEPGTYTVTLTAVVDGQTQTLSHSITITDPNAMTIVAPAYAAPNQPVTFYAQGPANGVYVWTFPSGNPSAAGTQTATTTWSELGTYTVNLMAIVNGQTQNLTHTIVISNIGIDDAATTDFGLYPNPATDKVTLTLGEASVVTLHDLTGREILRAQLPAGQHTLDLTPYSAGTYFLRAGGTARKLVVK